MVERRVEVVARLKALEESAAPLVNFLQNAAAVQELRADKQYNLQMLHERYQVAQVFFFSFYFLKPRKSKAFKRIIAYAMQCNTACVYKVLS